MEASGTGFDKITEDYRDADKSHRPFIESASDHFTLTLPDLTYTQGIRDVGLPAIEYVPVPHGSEYDEEILAYCYCSFRKTAEIAKHIGVSNSTYLRSDILENLVSEGYLEKSVYKNGARYRTLRDYVKTI